MRIQSIVMAIGGAPLLIGAAQPVRLQPSSPWVVDYAENSCRLIRNFGEGRALTKLAFESTAPDEMDMLIIGKPLETSEQKVAARFLPMGGKAFDGRVAQSVPDRQPAILWPNVQMMPDAVADAIKKKHEELEKNPSIRPAPISLAERDEEKRQAQAFAAATTELEIQTRQNHPVLLETGSLGDAMAALDKCSRDSLKDWGVDPDLEEKIARPVWTSNPSAWLFASDYPRDMLMNGKESEVAVRLLIDASGKITKCTSLSHFTEQEFNRITCANIQKRARFEPAELADGTKVPSYMTRRVVFRIAYPGSYR